MLPDLDLERRIQRLERFMREIHGDRGATAVATWTPTWTGLTVVGTPTYAGYYTRIGNIVLWIVIITAGGANTTASTVGTTYIDNMPFAAALANGFTVYSHVSPFTVGVGLKSGGDLNAFTPTWVATNANFSLSGWYNI